MKKFLYKLRIPAAAVMAAAMIVPAIPVIAAEQPAENEIYVVEQGDCLWNIAKEKLGSGARNTEIFELNRDILKSADLIFAGQQLKLPIFVQIAEPVEAPAEDEKNEDIAVTAIDKYGNLVLSVSGTELLSLGYTYGDMLTVNIGGKVYDMPVSTNYSDVENGSPICIVVIDEAADKDYVVLAINMDNLAADAEIAVKTSIDEEPGYRWDYNEGVDIPVSISIEMKEQGGYYAEYLLNQLARTNAREDYVGLTDRQFANFRAVETTGMGSGKLYRSSSPVNPELGRNTYSDKAAEAAGIKTVVNLADTAEGIAAYEGWADTYYSKCNVIGLNLGVDFKQADFQAGLAEGMRFMAENDGPYLIHCTEGKDRAGFVSALLECLMGASADEVVADYMVTYYNYYGVEEGTEQYDAIASGNIDKSLADAFGIDDIHADGVDLAAEAEGYMSEKLGLSAEEIFALKAKLS